MSTKRLDVKIDEEVFKLKDHKVGLLRSGQLSVEAFCLLTEPGDPYVLVGDTVYALSPEEYYGMRSAMPVNLVNRRVLDYILGLDDISFMSPADKLAVDRIRADGGSCPECRMRRHLDTVYRLIRKYGIKVPEELLDTGTRLPEDRYPETEGTIEPKVSDLEERLFGIPLPVRKSCLDCVEKHVSQAYILGRESLLGYPEHLALAGGHLAEAVDETPAELTELKRTLLFCLARTNLTRRPFVPVSMIAPLIADARKALDLKSDSSDTADSEPEDDGTAVELDLTHDMRIELETAVNTSPSMGKALMRVIQDIKDSVNGIESLPDRERDARRMHWIGLMSVLSDKLADSCPLTAAMLRSRRLAFSGGPEAAALCGCSTDDLEKAIGDSIEGEDLD